MNSTKEQVLERVKKMLAKVGRGATEDEAATAVAMAEAILRRHNLAMSDVEAVDRQWVEGIVHEGGNQGIETPYLVGIFERYFFVRILSLYYPDLGHYKTLVFGEPINVEAATWVWERLVDQFRDLLRKHRVRTGVSLACRSSYYLGLSCGLEERLKSHRVEPDLTRCAPSENSEGTEIVLARINDRIDSALRDIHPQAPPPLESSIEVNPCHYISGFWDSTNLSLGRPLTPPQASDAPLALTHREGQS